MGEAEGVMQWGGWQFPAGERHLPEWMKSISDIRDGRYTYQASKFDLAMSHCRRHRRAVDIGANIGLWSWLIAKRFAELDAFEPVPLYADCWRKNVGKGTLHPVALGEEAGEASMIAMTPGSCGDTTIAVGQPGNIVAPVVEVRTLDSYGFADVDFVKVDAEGFELYIMRGAAQTLTRCRPTVIVEQKPGHGKKFGLGDTEAIDYLRGLGMVVQAVISGDFVLTWA